MAQKKYEYKVIMAGSEQLERILNEDGSQGWRVVAVDFHSSYVEQLNGVRPSIVLLERELS